MIGLMKVAKQPHHHLQLSSDLQWWCMFLPRWNGRSILHQPLPTHSITSDASGSWGCGAFLSSGPWLQLAWPNSWAHYHIAAKEMVPGVIAIALWGRALSGETVLICSDNMAVVSTISSGAAMDPLLMHLARCLHFFLAEFDILLQAQHVCGAANTATDALSRNQLALFFPLCPTGLPTAGQDPLSTGGHAPTPLPRLARTQLEDFVLQYIGQSARPHCRPIGQAIGGSPASARRQVFSHSLSQRTFYPCL